MGWGGEGRCDMCKLRLTLRFRRAARVDTLKGKEGVMLEKGN